MQTKTYYHILLDQSGSMQDCIEPTLSGFNEQLQVLCSLEKRFPEQQIRMGLTRFSDEIQPTFYAQPPSTVQPLNRELYVPSGMTALHDAIGTTVLKLKDDFGEELVEGIASVVVVIITDGYENASTLFTLNGIKHLIKDLETTGKWTFTYLGATIDAIEVATRLNIKQENSLAFEKSKMHASYQMLNEALVNYVVEKRHGRQSNDFLKKGNR